MAAKRVEYEMTGRVMKGPEVIGYELKRLDTGKVGMYPRDQVVYLVGRGQVTNCTGEIYKDRVLLTGKGMSLNDLPKRIVQTDKQNEQEPKKDKLKLKINKVDNSAKEVVPTVDAELQNQVIPREQASALAKQIAMELNGRIASDSLVPMHRVKAPGIVWRNADGNIEINMSLNQDNILTINWIVNSISKRGSATLNINSTDINSLQFSYVSSDGSNSYYSKAEIISVFLNDLNQHTGSAGIEDISDLFDFD